MYKDGPMSQEPEDKLERMFAAEEAAIRDDGFTQLVVERAERVDKGVMLRRTAIYGAGLAGAGRYQDLTGPTSRCRNFCLR